MRMISALILCLCALPAAAQNLQGQWDVTAPGFPSYQGIALIDAEGRVTIDSPVDNGRPAKFRGYIDRRETTGIKIVLTDGNKVPFFFCATETTDRLHCYASRPDGSKSTAMLLTRVGPGPLTLAPR